MATDEPNTDELQKLLAQLQRPTAHTPAAEPNVAAGHESPTLQSLQGRRRPDPATVCEACPSSLWFASARNLKCYCRLMHAVTWSSEDPVPITACDGVMIGRE